MIVESARVLEQVAATLDRAGRASRLSPDLQQQLADAGFLVRVLWRRELGELPTSHLVAEGEALVRRGSELADAHLVVTGGATVVTGDPGTATEPRRGWRDVAVELAGTVRRLSGREYRPAVREWLGEVSSWELRAYRSAAAAGRPTPACPTAEVDQQTLSIELSDLLAQSAHVTAVDTVTGGAGKATVRIRLALGDRDSTLYARSESTPAAGSGGRRPAGTTPLTAEARLLAELAGLGLPVPPVAGLLRGDCALGAAAIVTHELAGDCLGTPYGGAAMTARWARRLAVLLAGVHAITPALLSEQCVEGLAAVGAGVGSEGPAEAVLRAVGSACAALAGASPFAERTLQWLAAHAPAAAGGALVLVHGDFGPHNVLADDAAVTALLDWEYAHLGEPAEDLGYVRDAIVPVMAWEQFEQAYLAAGGTTVEPERVAWYSVATWLRNFCNALNRMRAFDAAERCDLASPARIPSLARMVEKIERQLQP